MKKKVLSLALCLAMLAALTAPASAASTEAGNTVVTKTIEAQPDSGSSSDSDPGPYPVNVPSYEISIPATLSLDTGDSFEITASKMELDSRQELHVMVDYDRTFAPDGYFYLSNTENAALRIPCMISKGYASTAYWETITSQQNASVAVFNSTHGTTPDPGLSRYAHACGVKFSRFVGAKALLGFMVGQLQGAARAELYAYAVNRQEKGGSFSDPRWLPVYDALRACGAAVADLQAIVGAAGCLTAGAAAGVGGSESRRLASARMISTVPSDD